MMNKELDSWINKNSTKVPWIMFVHQGINQPQPKEQDLLKSASEISVTLATPHLLLFIHVSAVAIFSAAARRQYWPGSDGKIRSEGRSPDSSPIRFMMEANGKRVTLIAKVLGNLYCTVNTVRSLNVVATEPLILCYNVWGVGSFTLTRQGDVLVKS